MNLYRRWIPAFAGMTDICVQATTTSNLDGIPMNASVCGSILLFLGADLSCHRAPEVAPQSPLEGIDGKYSFSIDKPYLKMEGQFIVAYGEVYLLSPRHCVKIEGPKSSANLRAAWFECSGATSPSGPSLQLRFSEIDPINHSRFFSRSRERNIVQRCTRYNTNGDCVELLRARGMEWVQRDGAITVIRGFIVKPDSGKAPAPGDPRTLRTRCDTTATAASCGDSHR